MAQIQVDAQCRVHSFWHLGKVLHWGLMPVVGLCLAFCYRCFMSSLTQIISAASTGGASPVCSPTSPKLHCGPQLGGSASHVAHSGTEV